ncbi:macrophage mannose receptor 1 [Plakobranchus ocellatus]|uniref:Macrophage mannose receptor 1 n=1 Tax=Plakobranchus ocellatus TaxID=259542 RepID=A0AAV4A8Z3_9GAST|nr:macrophage mannose receptor 1 [Plakobranchus ocellatus]
MVRAKMLFSVNLCIVLTICCFGTRALFSNHYFTQIPINNIPSIYHSVASLTVSTKALCGIHCVRKPSCRYFLFNVTSLSCNLLGLDNPTDAFDLNNYVTWEVFTLESACPNSKQYIEQFDKCIKINTHIQLNWFDAQTACENDGGTLMIINSDAEFEFFQQLFASLIVSPDFFHLGARMLGPAYDDFYWVYGANVGAKVKSNHWAPSQPDNLFEDEYCIASRSDDNFYLNDITCAWYQGFYVCEYFL